MKENSMRKVRVNKMFYKSLSYNLITILELFSYLEAENLGKGLKIRHKRSIFKVSVFRKVFRNPY